MPVTPIAGEVYQVAAGGTSVEVFPGGINGGIITNPVAAADQGLGAAETLYVSPVGAADVHGNNITFALSPGQTWTAIPGQTTPTTVNANSSGHKFTAVRY